MCVAGLRHNDDDGRGPWGIAPPSAGSTMSTSRLVSATALLFTAKFFYWLLTRGVFPFVDLFCAGMGMS